jgi:hypothetical protein
LAEDPPRSPRCPLLRSSLFDTGLFRPQDQREELLGAGRDVASFSSLSLPATSCSDTTSSRDRG